MTSVMHVQVYEGDEWINEDHLRTARSHWHSYDDDFDDGPQPIEDEMFRFVLSRAFTIAQGEQCLRHERVEAVLPFQKETQNHFFM